MEKFEDMNLVCQDCGQPFEWTAPEQNFYKEHGLLQPKRCRECRAKKRASIAEKGRHTNDR